MGAWSKVTAFLSGAGSTIAGAGSKALGFFTGAATVVGTVDDGIKLAGQVVGEVHDHNQNVAGQDHVTAQTNSQAAKVNENVAKAAVANTDAAALDELRNGRG